MTTPFPQSTLLAVVSNLSSLCMHALTGAGVSFGAGLPLWGELVKWLADEAGMSPSEQTALKTLSSDFLDAARIIQNRLRY